MAASTARISAKKMKVFFPRHCLTQNSGLIFGWKIEKENIFVTATVNFMLENSYDLHALWESCSEFLNENDSVNSLSVRILGIWLNENHEHTTSDVLAATKNISLAEELIILRLTRNSCVPLLYFAGGKKRLDGSVVILYKQPSGNAFLTSRPPNVNISDFWRQFRCQEQMPSTELSEVLILLNNSCNEEARIHAALLESKGHSPCCNFFINLLLKGLSKVCGIFNQRSSDNHIIWTKSVKLLSNLSALFLQSFVRFSQLKELCMSVAPSRSTKDEKDSTESRNSSERVSATKEKLDGVSVFPVVWFGSLVTAMSIDIVVGVLIVLWLFTNGYNTCATDFMMDKTDNVVEFLSALLDWLKGAPAGLKLNKHLAEYLSKFFLYHIYLWQIYLSCIEPYLQIITSLIIMSGCLGVTFLLSLVSDVLSIVTLHIYCFYVYAARLYNLQLKKLITLFRLFTGRRWNVETNQVDIVPFKADRLFLGTLCFTVLLFLLPTTAMYYVVFTVLRLLVLFIKGIIARAIDIMNNLPVFPLIVACVRPDLIPGGVKFELLDSPDCSGTEISALQGSFNMGVTGSIPSVYLALHNQPLPITELLCHPLVDKFTDHDGYQHSWPALLGKLVKGELIYPWVKPRNSK